MKMDGVKIREAQMGQDDSSYLTPFIEDPKAMELMCLRACHHTEDIDQTDRLKFNKPCGYIFQLARFVHASSLANEGNCTFAATSGLRVMDVNRGPSCQGMTSNSKVNKSHSDKPLGTICTIAVWSDSMSLYSLRNLFPVVCG
jgi:hypothetical protein